MWRYGRCDSAGKKTQALQKGWEVEHWCNKWRYLRVYRQAINNMMKNDELQTSMDT